LLGRLFRPGSNQHGERIAGLPGANRYLHVAKSCRLHQASEIGFPETEAFVTQLDPHPFLAVGAEVEEQDASARHGNPDGFADGPQRILRVVKGLGKERDVDGLVTNGEFLELSSFPDDVGDAAATGQTLGPLDYGS
jgi:hypothetical protein